MKLLLDTHVLIWSSYDLPRLSKRARSIITSEETAVFFSAANIWKIAIKQSMGRGPFEFDATDLRNGLLAAEYGEVTVTSDHAIAAGTLPAVHRDPFDRLLVAQARVEGLTLVTADRQVAKYDGSILKV